MSTIAIDHTPSTATAPTSSTADAAAGSRARWPLAGLIGAVTGMASAMFALSNISGDKEDVTSGAAALAGLDHTTYHVAFLLGLVSVASLFVAAAGWRRWAEERYPGSLAARLIGTGVAATATVNIVFTCLYGSMAIYLPGGSDHGWLSDESVFVNFTLVDFGVLLGWWGTLFAAGAVATMAFGATRSFPRWLGIVTVVLMLPPIAFAVATGLPGFVGFAMPIWLAVLSITELLRRRPAVARV